MPKFDPRARRAVTRAPSLLLWATTACATVAVASLSTMPAAAQRAVFRLEEASIADVHRAILARQLTATQLVGDYLKRIEAYNGTCVKGAVDPATGFQLGDIEPVGSYCRAERFGQADRFGESFGVDVRERELGALRRKINGQRSADAGSSSGDDGDFVFESVHFTATFTLLVRISADI